MELTVEHMQIAGIAVIVLIGLAFLVWIVRTVIRVQSGHPVYLLPDNSHDDHAADDHGDDRPTEVHIHPH